MQFAGCGDAFKVMLFVNFNSKFLIFNQVRLGEKAVFQMKHLGGPNCFQKFSQVSGGGIGGKTVFQDLCSTGTKDL